MSTRSLLGRSAILTGGLPAKPSMSWCASCCCCIGCWRPRNASPSATRRNADSDSAILLSRARRTASAGRTPGPFTCPGERPWSPTTGRGRSPIWSRVTSLALLAFLHEPMVRCPHPTPQGRHPEGRPSAQRPGSEARSLAPAATPGGHGRAPQGRSVLRQWMHGRDRWCPLPSPVRCLPVPGVPWRVPPSPPRTAPDCAGRGCAPPSAGAATASPTSPGSWAVRACARRDRT